MLSDRILIWKFNSGSADALCAIYRKYRGTMLTVAAALCHDVHAAEDIVQDCFIAFARTGRQLKIHGSLKGYLVAGVVNRVRDYYRAGKRRMPGLDETAGVPCPHKGPRESAIVNEELSRLSRALVQLPCEQREVLVLYTRGQMTYREIANLQNVSIPTVQRRYHSGLDRLRVLLNGEAEK